MGICPRCGSFVDEGEPYCSDCSYVFSSSQDDLDHDRDRLEEVLGDWGYDMYDFENDLIDPDDLEEILDEIRF
ncbi:hypothetical protein [uncultured Methanobrevibacter sp.]|uniref:hypothetical protein n=1 Tax=uncultured Methanobrevibacter sp. TaxID=253161 RepID=UPI00260A7E52|nr:hypothetical protein [uncultured Methanobrevibacter sp.]